MMRTTFVFGAGADSGIFPLTNHLVSAIDSFLKRDPAGTEIDRLLKKKLGFKNFSYASIMDSAAYTFIRKNDQIKIEKLLNRMSCTQSETLPLNQRRQQKFISLVAKDLLSSSKKQRDSLKIMETRPQTVDLAQKIGLTKLVTVCPETTITMFYRQSLRMMLRIYLDEPDNKILHLLFKSVVSLDEILLEYFLGFYNENKPYIRRYQYLLWTMWAFFVTKELNYVRSGRKEKTIYELIKGCPVITLNYTTVAALCPSCPELIHFHGSVLEYIDCQTREVKKIPSFTNVNALIESPNLDTVAILKNDILPRIELQKGKNSAPDKSVIPSMMPPFEIKPIIANDLIDSWHHAFDLLRESHKIVVLGYSFNHTDAHFNDIIIDFIGKKDGTGKWKKQIYIINPDLKSIQTYFDKMENLTEYKWIEGTVHNTKLKTVTKANITIIPATTWEVIEKNVPVENW